jgi:dienelactone hydrolase
MQALLASRYKNQPQPALNSARLHLMKSLLPLLLLCPIAFAQTAVNFARDDGAMIKALHYTPSKTEGCAPALLLSHGAGGSEKGLAFLAKAAAAAGWQAVAVEHAESNTAVVRGLMRGRDLTAALAVLTTDSKAYSQRLADLRAAQAWLEKSCKPSFVALAGHSMGAATSLLAAGGQNNLGVSAQDRYQAYIALSPQGPGAIFPKGYTASINKPILFLTGTADKALEGEPSTRLLPFEWVGSTCAALGVLAGGTHMHLGGVGLSADNDALLTQTVLQFLQSVKSGGCAKLTGAAGFELKQKY